MLNMNNLKLHSQNTPVSEILQNGLGGPGGPPLIMPGGGPLIPMGGGGPPLPIPMPGGIPIMPGGGPIIPGGGPPNLGGP